MMMLLDGQEMSRNNYVIPTAVLQRLIDAAGAARHNKCTGCLSTADVDPRMTNKLGLQLADVVEVQSLLSQLARLETSPGSASSASSYSDAGLQAGGAECQKRTSLSKSSTVVVVNPARYKTELCRQFEENGSCRYGDKCQFAHGVAELRSLVRHPKYKTEMCRTFHTTGFCPYGLRCHFIHNDDERRIAVAAAAAFDVAPGRRPDAAAVPGPVLSPPLLAPMPGDALQLVAHPPPPSAQARPIFRSSLSPTLSLPEVDSEQRGRPILARSSTIPERTSPTYPAVVCAVNQHVTFPAFSDPHCVADDFASATVRAPCA